MPEAASPYRGAVRPAGPRLVLRPLRLTRLMVMLAVLAIAPTALFLCLWSRVVTVACQRAPDETVQCDVREEAIVGVETLRAELHRVREVRLAGETETRRGDAWIEVETLTGVVQLTRGFADAKDDQLAAADRLDRWFSSRAGSITVSFGSRSRFVLVPLLALVVAAVGLVIFSLRVVVTVDRAHGLLVAERRWFPLRATRAAAPLDEVTGFAAPLDARGRAVITATLRSGETTALFLAHALLAERVVEDLAGLLEEARQG